MEHEKFWLYDWIDTFEVKDRNQATRLLNDPGIVRGLRKRAMDVPFTTDLVAPSDAPTIVAGQAIDLSGQLDCLHWDCLKKQVDNLFSHVWHYFDRIVVVGPSAHGFSRLLEPDPSPNAIEKLLTYVELLLYIRKIGAEKLLLFRQKRPPCEHHFDDHMREVGLDPISMLSNQRIAQFTNRAKISVEPHDDHLDYTFIHPDFEHTVWGSIEMRNSESQLHAVTASVMKKYLSSLSSDIYTSHVLNSPLGSTINFHGQLLNTIKDGLHEGEVAFNLQLPVLEGIPPEILIKIRNDQQPHFEKFRQSLRLAIKERLNVLERSNATAIAEEIRKDVIIPALSDIEVRLNGARDSVTKKAGLSIILGTLSTTFGLLSANPVAIGAGVTAAVGGTLAAGQKYIEEKRDVTLSDMYFLWQASPHKRH